MRHSLLATLKLSLMPSRKRSVASSISSQSKRKRIAQEKSPLASRGLELEIGHAPEPYYPPSAPASPTRHVKTEPTTPRTPTKIENLKREAPSKMSPSKLRILESLGSTPFPEFPHPTADECRRVNAALTKAHGKRVRPKELNST